MEKQFTTVKDLVFTDLQGLSKDEVLNISQFGIETYFDTLRRRKAHLCARPLRLATVNRNVERFLKKLE